MAIGLPEPRMMVPAFYPNYRVGNYYCSNITADDWANWGAPTPADSLRACPFVVSRSIRVDRIGVQVGVAGAVGCRIRLGIYRDLYTVYPGILIPNTDVAELNGEAIAWVENTIDVWLHPEPRFPMIYWLAQINNNPGAGTLELELVNRGLPMLGSFSGGAQPQIRYNVNQAYGALPATFPSPHTTTNANLVNVMVRIAEVAP